MRRLILAVPFFALFLVGCPDKPKEDATKATPSASASTVASAAASASAAPADSASADSRMSHCPAAVDGASVDIKDVEGGVEVAVTGKDDASGKEIRARMAKLLDVAKTAQSDAGAAHHDGSGGGHGR
ncbi:MAG TPA: hypothetical protein VIF62_33215, partial [Labilithrix sp.]